MVCLELMTKGGKVHSRLQLHILTTLGNAGEALAIRHPRFVPKPQIAFSSAKTSRTARRIAVSPALGDLFLGSANAQLRLCQGSTRKIKTSLVRNRDDQKSLPPTFPHVHSFNLPAGRFDARNHRILAT